MSSTRFIRVLSALSLLTAAAFASPALANERHFTLLYESAVLPVGARELEYWATPRFGRDGFFMQLDHRLEFEVGVADRLQTAVYLNVAAGNELNSTPTAVGVSNEWKYKLLDPVADPVGLALYLEVTVLNTEVELEGKVIADKMVGPVLLAANAVAEYDWELTPNTTERETVVEADVGASYLIGRFGIGVEMQSQALFSSDAGFESNTFLGGPVLSYGANNWWAAISFLPQFTSIKSPEFLSEFPGPLELHDHQKYMVRALFSFHL